MRFTAHPVRAPRSISAWFGIEPGPEAMQAAVPCPLAFWVWLLHRAESWL